MFSLHRLDDGLVGGPDGGLAGAPDNTQVDLVVYGAHWTARGLGTTLRLRTTHGLVGWLVNPIHIQPEEPVVEAPKKEQRDT